jgi:hypothetical protein
MSNVFSKGTAPFYSVPQFLITSGLLKELSAGALKLYQLLLFTAQKRTKVELEMSNLEIRNQADLSPNTIRRGRTKLKEVGLVDLKQISGGRYTYVILNPLTGSPLPHPRSPQGGNSPAIPSMASTPTPSSASVSPPWSQIGK